jgi:hypothetical protein
MVAVVAGQAGGESSTETYVQYFFDRLERLAESW